MITPEVVDLEGKKRETGRKAADALRDAMRVPCVLYGPMVEENVHFSIDELEFEKVLSESKRQILNITVDGEEYNTLLKEVEFHPLTDRPVHADFYVMAEDRKVTLSVPIRLEGTPVGVTEGGGRIFQPMHILRIRVKPDLIPGAYTVDVSNLEIGDSLHVRDLELEGIIPLDDLAQTLVTIRPPKSEALLTSSLITEEPEEELEEGEEALEEGEELAEGEEAEEGEETEGDEEETEQ
ncbi:50S ribosomal protein L25 [Aliifodinibius salipaludis]|uniref:Large ribosomal subunit protein bL25 n=1 Tax=Fodinibius salipaludis TaxID=2032627 RepID=A0A2A2G783_9BACT|nr:50S ribosomal protein L25 [Aliifodinibius salipaludis]PAU93000.1 50S ribosomal protein L25 [Aliifodinibius salipaludis]